MKALDLIIRAVVVFVLLFSAVFSPVQAAGRPQEGPPDDPAAAGINTDGPPPASAAADPALAAVTNVKVLCYETNTTYSTCARVKGLVTNTTTVTSAASVPGLLAQYKVLYIAFGSVNTLAPYAAQIQSFISRGGGLVLEQPNAIGSVPVLPASFAVTVSSSSWNEINPQSFTSQAAVHPITQGLSTQDLSGNFDTVYTQSMGAGYTKLAYVTNYPTQISLAAGPYGSGRIVFYTGNVCDASLDQGSDAYVQRLVLWAGAQSTLIVPMQSEITSFITASQSQINSINGSVHDVAAVGDYFLDMTGEDGAELVVNLFFNSLETLTAGVKWGLVGRGMNHITTRGYEAARHASWNGWTKTGPARHFLKPLYDSLHNNRKLLFTKTSTAGLRYLYDPDGPAVDVGLEILQNWLVDIFKPGPTTPFYTYFDVPYQQLGTDYKSDLSNEMQITFGRMAGRQFTAGQTSAYLADLQARQNANAAVVDQLDRHRDLLWNGYQKKLEDEASWWNFWGPLLIKWAVIGACTLAWDGPGFYISSAGTAAAQTVYDAVADSRAIAQDQKMFDQSLRFLSGRASLAYGDVADNSMAALNMLRAGDPPQTAKGSVSLSSMNSYGHYRLWPNLWWAEERSDVKFSISNPSTFETTYLTSADYVHSGWWIGQQALLVEGQSLDLAGASSGTVTIPLRMDKDGVSPDKGSTLNALVLGLTGTGTYAVNSTAVVWNPSNFETSTLTAAGPQALAAPRLAELPAGVTAQQAADAPIYGSPVTSGVTPLTGSADYLLTIDVVNPFDINVHAQLVQAVPAAFTVQNAGGGTFSGGQITWIGDLEPHTALQKQVVLRWNGAPGETLTLPGAQLTYTSPEAAGSDSYTALDLTVQAAWPLESSADLPYEWAPGGAVPVTLTLTNLSASAPVSGSVALKVQTQAGTDLLAQAQPYSIPAGGTGEVTFNLTAPQTGGFLTISAETTQGAETRTLLEDIVWNNRKIYLPGVYK